MTRTFGTEWVAYCEAERLWSDVLHSAFGKSAGDVRYTKRAHGDPGSGLRELYDDYAAKREAWYQAVGEG